MKKFLSMTLAALCCMGCMTSFGSYNVYADNSDEIVSGDGAGETEDEGYYLVDSAAGVGFRSYDDYLQSRDKAYDKIKGSDSSGEDYLAYYDYLYVPAEYKDHPEKITDIFITPRYCKVSFGDVFVTYYYIDDNRKESHEYTNFAVPFGHKTTVGDVDYYFYDHPYEGGRYCNDNGKYLYFSEEIDPEETDGKPLAKIYLDSHFTEENGKLYYINDSGKKESGWHSIGGHQYYFRKSDKSAVCGKKVKIGGVVYKFNANGVCQGKSD